MYTGWLSFMMSAAFATASDAQFQALTLAGPDSLGFPVEPTTMDTLEQYETSVSHQDTLGMLGHAKRATLQRSGLLIASITAVLAMTFMVLQCFRALGSLVNFRVTMRRLAEGGAPREGVSCEVSPGQSSPFKGLTIPSVPSGNIRHSVSALDCCISSHAR